MTIEDRLEKIQQTLEEISKRVSEIKIRVVTLEQILEHPEILGAISHHTQCRIKLQNDAIDTVLAMFPEDYGR
jgi:prefoldin subunit 5